MSALLDRADCREFLDYKKYGSRTERVWCANMDRFRGWIESVSGVAWRDIDWKEFFPVWSSSGDLIYRVPIPKRIVLQFLDTVTDPRHPYRRYGHLKALRVYFDYLVVLEALEPDDNPMPTIPSPWPAAKEQHFLSEEELLAFLSELKRTSYRDYVIAYVLSWTAMRVNELLRMRTHDVIRYGARLGKTKTRSHDTRALPDPAREEIERWLASRGAVKGEFIFPGRGASGHYSNRNFLTVLKNAAVAAGISGPITAHMLRRTAGTLMYENGMPEAHVQTVLGHKSPSSTRAYLARTVMDAKVYRALRKFHMGRLWDTGRLPRRR